MIMKLLGRATIWMRHLACGLTGAAAFGFVAYLLDIGGIQAAGQMGDDFANQILMSAAALVGFFAGIDILMQRLMGGPGQL